MLPSCFLLAHKTEAYEFTGQSLQSHRWHEAKASFMSTHPFLFGKLAFPLGELYLHFV